MVQLSSDIEQAALLSLVEAHFDPHDLAVKTIDQLGRNLVDPDALGFGDPSFWDDLKAEFHDLLCTESAKYRDLRSKFSGMGKKSEASLVGLISTAMAPSIGLAAAMLGPFCALCLIASTRLGKNAFCSSWSLDEKIVPAK